MKLTWKGVHPHPHPRVYLHWLSIEEEGGLLLLEVEVQRPERLVEVEDPGVVVKQVTREGRPAAHVGQENDLHLWTAAWTVRTTAAR